MKTFAILGIFVFAAFSSFSQEKKTVKPLVNKTNSTLKRVTKKNSTKPLTSPKPGVNNATDSNRKRPGGTLHQNTNSKQEAPKPKKPPVKSGDKKIDN